MPDEIILSIKNTIDWMETTKAYLSRCKDTEWGEDDQETLDNLRQAFTQLAALREDCVMVPRDLIFSRRQKCIKFAQSVKLSSEYTWDHYMIDLYKIMIEPRAAAPQNNPAPDENTQVWQTLQARQDDQVRGVGIEKLREAYYHLEMELAAMYKRPPQDPIKKNLDILLQAARAYLEMMEKRNV